LCNDAEKNKGIYLKETKDNNIITLILCNDAEKNRGIYLKRKNMVD